MINAGVLTFQEYAMREALPLATIHQAVFDWLRDREDVVLFGAHAVNAYVPDPRMTQDVDLLSTRASALAEELRAHLSQAFPIAVRVRILGGGRGLRLFQVRKDGNRHLVDIRPVSALPPARRIAGVPVIVPEDLIAAKVWALRQRRGQPKSGTDWRDLALLLVAFPELKAATGAVRDRLLAAGAGDEILALWDELAASEFETEDEDADFPFDPRPPEA